MLTPCKARAVFLGLLIRKLRRTLLLLVWMVAAGPRLGPVLLLSLGTIMLGITAHHRLAFSLFVGVVRLRLGRAAIVGMVILGPRLGPVLAIIGKMGTLLAPRLGADSRVNGLGVHVVA